jgi:hypothetical protein
MTTTAANRHFATQPPVSAPARVATAIAVAAVVACAWLGAEHASQEAVRAATETLSAGTAAKHVTLPMVKVVGRREAAAVKRV